MLLITTFVTRSSQTFCYNSPIDPTHDENCVNRLFRHAIYIRGKMDKMLEDNFSHEMKKRVKIVRKKGEVCLFGEEGYWRSEEDRLCATSKSFFQSKMKNLSMSIWWLRGNILCYDISDRFNRFKSMTRATMIQRRMGHWVDGYIAMCFSICRSLEQTCHENFLL